MGYYPGAAHEQRGSRLMGHVRALGIHSALPPTVIPVCDSVHIKL